MNGNLVPKRFISLGRRLQGRASLTIYLCFRWRCDYISWLPARLEQLMGIRAGPMTSARTWVGTFERRPARLLFVWRSRPTAPRWDWAVCWRSEESGSRRLSEINDGNWVSVNLTLLGGWIRFLQAWASDRNRLFFEPVYSLKLGLWSGRLYGFVTSERKFCFEKLK